MAKNTPASASDAPSADDTAAQSDEKTVKKGRPTPSRKEAQAQRAQPLVGSAARPRTKTEKQAVADARERTRAGYAAGEDRYLTVRDKGPQRRYARDFVDARTSIGEWMLAIMFLALIMTFIDNQVINLISLFTIWGYLAAMIIDSTILSVNLKRRLIAKFGAEKLEKGVSWYAIMRSIQFRRLRLPKPQVRRGEYPK